MELVTCIAGKIVDYSVEPIKRQVDYVIHCKSNHDKLGIELNDLADARRTIGRNIDEAEKKGEIILEEVKEWVKEVDKVTEKANQLKDEFVNGCCLNLKMRHQLSRKSIQLVEKVVRLRNKEFPKISSGHLMEEVGGIPTGDYLPFDSRESTEDQIIVELKNPNTVRIGVCGIGGVGKTTLVKQLFIKLAKHDTSVFDKVAILFDVKSIQEDLEGIQKQIVEKLGMNLLEGETMVKRKDRLCGYIIGKKILIILDDVQTKIDLEQLGVPGVATCKILLTSRIPIFGTDKGFQLGFLPEEEAWELFVKKAVVGDKDPAIQSVAKKVAKKCGGLPVLVVTVASSLKDKNRLHSWNNALRCLKEFDHSDKSPEKEAHSTIEWSYNQLDDSMLKDLFLLCGTTVRGNRISLEDLLKYSMGLSEFKNNHTVEQTRNAFYSKVEKLKDFCLLIDGEDDTSVRMHDIVRDAARHIALRDHHMLSAVLEDGGDDQSDQEGWPNKELTEKCTTISFPSAHNIPEVLQCPALKMLCLQGHNWHVSLKILPGFFEEMKQLRVLSLGHMHLPSLPSSLQFLNNLQTLCIHQCGLRDLSLVGQLSNLEILSFEGSDVGQLPKEIGQLTRLRLLDLSECYKLKVVSPGVLSSLTRLEELRMRNSFNNWMAAGDRSNASLFELNDLSQLTALEIHVLDANILPADFLSHELKRFQLMIGDKWSWDYEGGRTHNTLKLNLTTTNIELERGLKKLLKICDDLSLDGTESVNHIDRELDSQDCPQVRLLCVPNNVDFEYIRNKDVFPNLTTLSVYGYDRLSFLFSFSMAKSLLELKHLKISFCGIMEAIVECGQENMDNMFSKLEDLELTYLPKLTKFCSDPEMPVSRWPLLKRLKVSKCLKVKSFAAEHTFFKKIHESNPQTQQSLFLIDKSSFLNLEHLELGDMDIWSGPPSAELVLGKLKYLQFGGRASLVPHHVMLFPDLEIIEVSCSSCEEIFVNEVNTSCVEIHVVGSATLPHVRQLTLHWLRNVLHLGNSQSAAVAGPLFPNLQILHVEGCERLKNVESSTISFQNLTTLTVQSCWELEYLTSYSVAKSLVQLTKLEVSHCDNIVAIVQASNIVGDDAAENEIAFSRLQHLKLYNLPGLQGFCSSGNCIVKFPPSVTLGVRYCPIELNISPYGVLQTEIKVDKDRRQRRKGVDDDDQKTDIEVTSDEIFPRERAC